MRWVRKWQVHGTKDHIWTVALDKNGAYGCSCPKWIFQKTRPRIDCHHIEAIKESIGRTVLKQIIPHQIAPLTERPREEFVIEEMTFQKRRIKI